MIGDAALLSTRDSSTATLTRVPRHASRQFEPRRVAIGPSKKIWRFSIEIESQSATGSKPLFRRRAGRDGATVGLVSFMRRTVLVGAALVITGCSTLAPHYS